MRFRISKIGPDGLRLENKLSHGWFADVMGEECVKGESAHGKIDLFVSMTGSTVTVRGRVSGHFHVLCSRCLEPARVDLDTELVLVLEEQAVEFIEDIDEEKELSQEDLNFAFYTGDEIDLKPYVREQFLLAIPIAPLCKDDCWPEYFSGLVETVSGEDLGRAGAGEERDAKNVQWKEQLERLKERGNN